MSTVITISIKDGDEDAITIERTINSARKSERIFNYFLRSYPTRVNGDGETVPTNKIQATKQAMRAWIKELGRHGDNVAKSAAIKAAEDAFEPDEVEEVVEPVVVEEEPAV